MIVEQHSLLTRLETFFNSGYLLLLKPHNIYFENLDNNQHTYDGSVSIVWEAYLFEML